MQVGVLRRSIVSMIAGALVVVPSSLHAAPTSKLTYVRAGTADSCPDESALRRAVARRVGYDPFFPFAERTVVAQIDAVPQGFTAQVRIVDARGIVLGERILEKVRICDELVQNVALAISVAMDDLETAGAMKPAPARESPPLAVPDEALPAPASASVPAPAAEALPRTTPRWEARTALGVVGSLGAAPSASFGGVLGVAAARSWLRIGLEGRADLPSSDSVGGRGRIVTTLLVGSLVPCGVLRGKLTPYVCAVGSFGRFSASAEGIAEPASNASRWTSLGGRAGLELAVADAVAVFAHLEGGGTMTRHRLEIDGRTVFTLPPGWASIGAGLVATVF
jgi:hypothetical protein